MPRVVAVEALDHLAPDDQAAVRSRRDLQRVHRFMGTRSIVLRAMVELLAPHRAHAPLRILELGCGDGSLMLGVARASKRQWPAVELTLLDRLPLIVETTIADYAALGWRAIPQVTDVLDWAAEALPSAVDATPSSRWDLIVANLFLHHFENAQLATLLAAIASRCEHFFACEPRRARLALVGSHLMGAIGANAVTREDAVLSVHAGFRDAEISALWPPPTDRWTLNEYSAGLFSHCLRAAHIEQTG